MISNDLSNSGLSPISKIPDDLISLIAVNIP